MDQVLHADDAELAQGALNEVVGGDRGTVASDLRKSGVKLYFKLVAFRGQLFKVLYQTFSGHCANVEVGNVGYRKIHSRTAYSPAAQNE